MGLITFALEALAVSSGMAAVRQFLDYSARDFVLPRITHPLANQIASGYFEAGEYCVTKAVEFYNSSESGKKNKD
jgi:hypothetical protein